MSFIANINSLVCSNSNKCSSNLIKDSDRIKKMTFLKLSDYHKLIFIEYEIYLYFFRSLTNLFSEHGKSIKKLKLSLVKCLKKFIIWSSSKSYKKLLLMIFIASSTLKLSTFTWKKSVRRKITVMKHLKVCLLQLKKVKLF